MDETNETLRQIQKTLSNLQHDYQALAQTIETLNGRVNVLAGVQAAVAPSSQATPNLNQVAAEINPAESTSTAIPPPGPDNVMQQSETGPESSTIRRPSLTSRIILTTYPRQSGIDPIPLTWGHSDPRARGPVVVSRNPSTVRRRNGAVSGFLARW